MATTSPTIRPQKRKNEDEDEEKPIIAKTPTDLQRLRLEKLMKHPEKPVPIPERPKEKSMPHVPDFVRNVMGSSAGAGSGEFHVYRHLRRKEYARQKFIQEKAEKETKDEDYHKKLEDNKRLAEEKTAKKRAKRLKKKQKMKYIKKNKPINESSKIKDPETEDSDTEDEDKGENESQSTIDISFSDSPCKELSEKENNKSVLESEKNHPNDEKLHPKHNKITPNESSPDDSSD